MSIKDSVLTALTESRDQFLSGEELSNRFNVSRTAIWKAINTLREEGYSIDAVTNKGYHLAQDHRLITEKSLRLYLPSRYKTNGIHIYETLDSTNTRAKQLALEGAPHGSVVMAHQQTGGRGRLGRSFFSPQEGIYLTLIIKPNFDLSKSVLVTSAAAVAVCESIGAVCGKQAGIKWVNDVYIDDKKVCGILTEGITDLETGQIETLVIGIGVNTTINGFPAELLDSAGAVTGNYSRSALAAGIMTRTLDLMNDIESRAFIESYKANSIVIGKTVNVYKGTYKKNPDDEIPSRLARVLDIDKDGGLIVLYTDGSWEILTSGEITIRI